MATDAAQKGPWFGTSDTEVRERFLAHCKQSAYPEEFPGIRVGAVPSNDRNPRIVFAGFSADPSKRTKLSTDPTKRTDCWVPCNICGIPKFFLTGDLIRDDDGWLYIVGGTCGETHFGDRYRTERERYNREEQERRASEYLLDVFPRIPEWHAANVSLQPYALAAARAHETIANLPTFVEEVRRAINRDGGVLRVRGRRTAMRADGSMAQVADWEEFGRVTGAAAVSIKSDFLFRLDQASRVLKEFGETEESAFARIGVASQERQLPELMAALTNAINETHAVRTELVQCRAFFQEANLITLSQWTRHPDAPIAARITVARSVWTFRARSGATAHRVDIRDFVDPVPKVPD